MGYLGGGARYLEVWLMASLAVMSVSWRTDYRRLVVNGCDHANDQLGLPIPKAL